MQDKKLTIQEVKEAMLKDARFNLFEKAELAITTNDLETVEVIQKIIKNANIK